jgi:hypothetical protein
MSPMDLLKAFTELPHVIDAEGGVQILSAHWSIQAKAEYVAQIRLVKVVLTAWEPVLLGEIGETAGVHRAVLSN